MTRETKEERKIRELAETAQRDAERVEFNRTLPKRMMEAHALAESMQVGVKITLNDTGPVLVFHDEERGFVDDHVSYGSSEWEIERIERILQDIKIDIEARVYRHKLAQDTFNKLSADEKTAIKEFIHYLV